jgi:hypothetical protein
VLLGIALGMFSWGADGLPSVLGALGNAVGPWLAVAFTAGALQPGLGRGAAAGAIGLLTAVVVYYAAGLLSWPGVPQELVSIVVAWLAVAAAAGPLLGAAGAVWAAGTRWAPIALGILAGGLGAEAAYRFIEVEGWTGIDFGRTSLQVWAVDVVAAALLPIVLLDRGRRARAYLATLGATAVGLVLIAAARAAIRAVVFGA